MSTRYDADERDKRRIKSMCGNERGSYGDKRRITVMRLSYDEAYEI